MSKLKLPIIVFSQFLCTSLWFSGNSILENSTLNANSELLGHITSAVQLGFIFGTLIYALLAIPDRFSPSKVFCISAVFASLSNLFLLYHNLHFEGILISRFSTGFFLAGIYPVGLKIAVDHYEKDLGKPLGFVVGALVLGTALPHLLKGIQLGLDWQTVIVVTSILAVIGGFTTWIFIPDGKYQKKTEKLKLTSLFSIFKSKSFRKVAFSYFGHNWELYSFWAFVPQILYIYGENHRETEINIPLLSFFIIGAGSIGCIISGFLSKGIETEKIASLLLLLSGICCILSPVLFSLDSIYSLVTILTLWGVFAVSDSPLFSRLMAENAPSQSRGTALTIANCLGFLITVISIQLIGNLTKIMNPQFVFILMGIGPILGLLSLKSQKS